MSIHPTAIIENNVILGDNVTVDEYSIIRSGAKIGSGSKIGTHVEITGHVNMGENNKVYKGACIGGDPQDVKFKSECISNVIIGNNNIIREFTTIHRGSVESGVTKIGNDNFFMCNAHVGHDCTVGNNVVLTNSATLGGWSIIEDGAILSAFVATHQFCKVGRLSFIGGFCRIVQDVPPFCIVAPENPTLFGLNTVGLRRAGIALEQRNALKRAYSIMFREKLSFKEKIQKIRSTIDSPEVEHFLKFIEESKRGVVSKH